MKLKHYCKANLVKTLFFNFFHLPLRQAWRLPVIIFKGTRIMSMKGKIRLPEKVEHAMIKFGSRNVAGWEQRITTLSIDGELIFHGKASLGSGSTIAVQKNAALTIGSDFLATAGTSILCNKKIELGRECLISWDTLIMDADYHTISDQAAGNILNEDEAVHIGSHVWIGCRNTILKGVRVGDGCVIAAGSVLTKSFEGTVDSIIAGSGKEQRVLRSGITWKE